MTEKNMLLKAIKRIAPKGKNEFYRIEENDIVIIGADTQEIIFRFDEKGNIIWFE